MTTVERAKKRLGEVVASKWKLERLLGVGGMASVYEAVHRNNKRVAVKLLDLELSGDPDQVERFVREGYAANSVDHPGIVSIDDDGLSDDGCPFLVMELLRGETLAERIKREGALPVELALRLTDELLEVLEAAHRAGVVHRDVKPENVFLETSGHLRVLDFGIARMPEAGGRAKTKPGTVMGTPAFMSPEQARGRWSEVDAQSDLWAVAATLFTVLSGAHVHEAETENEQLGLAMTAPARSLGSVIDDSSVEVVAFVDRALAYEKRARFSDVRAMRRALRNVVSRLGHDPLPELVEQGSPVESLSDPRAGASSFSGMATTAPDVARDYLASEATIQRARRRRVTLTAAGLGVVGVGLLVSLPEESAGPTTDASAAYSATPEPASAASDTMLPRAAAVDARVVPEAKAAQPESEPTPRAKERQPRRAPKRIAPRPVAQPASNSPPAAPAPPSTSASEVPPPPSTSPPEAPPPAKVDPMSRRR